MPSAGSWDWGGCEWVEERGPGRPNRGKRKKIKAARRQNRRR